jgi:capsule biosynthesis phosphatase
MNIIIPTAGTGKRFVDAGYSSPKPLVNVLGEPMIYHVIRNLKVDPYDAIYIVYTQDLDKYQFQSMLKKEFPETNLNFILLKYRTRGPVETVLCGLNQISDLDQKTLVLDCDTFYRDDILGFCRGENKDFIFYFTDACQDAIFSYIQIEAGRVSDIREKEKISDYACTGAYGFRSGRELKRYCEWVLNSENKARGEYYISSVYSEMIKDGAMVIPYPVYDFHCLGTPQQLQTYCLANGASPKRFCFDLDGTLVTFPEQPGDYGTVKPIMKNIKLARSLHEQGHTIIIQTARKMLTSHYNAGEATARAAAGVFSTLAQYDIPFDEIYFGKPHAHFYIDDLSVKPHDLEREMGFYDGQIEPRHFNRVEYGEDWVRKTANNSGEIYWYRHIPASADDHFPRVLEIEDQTIRMEKIKGIVFSYLLVNNSLTRHNLQSLLEALQKLHACQEVDAIDLNYMENYNAKIAQRYFEYNYRSLSDSVECQFLKIAARLANHEPVPGVIHGDPVFSNVFLCDHGFIRFIDMRGKVGEVETIFGDIFYDYAKVYQSLYGYDFILNDCEINVIYLRELREYFEARFIEMFSPHLLETLRYITAGLFFSLIPLHREREKQKKYLGLVEEILE